MAWEQQEMCSSLCNVPEGRLRGKECKLGEQIISQSLLKTIFAHDAKCQSLKWHLKQSKPLPLMTPHPLYLLNVHSQPELRRKERVPEDFLGIGCEALLARLTFYIQSPDRSHTSRRWTEITTAFSRQSITQESHNCEQDVEQHTNLTQLISSSERDQ